MAFMVYDVEKRDILFWYPNEKENIQNSIKKLITVLQAILFRKGYVDKCKMIKEFFEKDLMIYILEGKFEDTPKGKLIYKNDFMEVLHVNKFEDGYAGCPSDNKLMIILYDGKKEFCVGYVYPFKLS